MTTVYYGKPVRITQVANATKGLVTFTLTDQIHGDLVIEMSDETLVYRPKSTVVAEVGSKGLLYIASGYCAKEAFKVFPWDPKYPEGYPGGATVDYYGLRAEVRGVITEVLSDGEGPAVSVRFRLTYDGAPQRLFVVRIDDRAMVDRHFSEGGRTELHAGFGASGLLFLSEAFLEMAKIPIPENAPRASSV